MGSISAMNSIDLVLKKHGEEIRKEYEGQVPAALDHIFNSVVLENRLHAIEVTWVFTDGSTLQGPMIDIDTLADQYPECDLAY